MQNVIDLVSQSGAKCYHLNQDLLLSFLSQTKDQSYDTLQKIYKTNDSIFVN